MSTFSGEVAQQSHMGKVNQADNSTSVTNATTYSFGQESKATVYGLVAQWKTGIPQGATITSDYALVLTRTGVGGSGSTDMNVSLRLENKANADVYIGGEDLDNRVWFSSFSVGLVAKPSSAPGTFTFTVPAAKIQEAVNVTGFGGTLSILIIVGGGQSGWNWYTDVATTNHTTLSAPTLTGSWVQSLTLAGPDTVNKFFNEFFVLATATGAWTAELTAGSDVATIISGTSGSGNGTIRISTTHSEAAKTITVSVTPSGGSAVTKSITKSGPENALANYWPGESATNFYRGGANDPDYANDKAHHSGPPR